MNIRKASTHDFPAILSLIQEFAVFQNTPEKVTITLPQMQAEASFFQCFIAETDAKEIIGFASFFFAYYSWSGKAVYLDDLYVTAPYRKQGIGKQLLGAVIQLAKDTQCKKVRWQVSKWNHHAIAFYTQMGAVVDEVEINCEVPIPTSNTHQY